MKKKIIIIFMAIATAVLAYVFIDNNGSSSDEMELSGNIEATEVRIGFETAGRIADMRAKEGDHVKKGDVMAAIDDSKLKSAAAQARAALNESRARLKELQSGYRPQEISQAKSLLSAAESAFENAHKDFIRAETLYKDNGISAQRFDAAKSDLFICIQSFEK